MDKLRKLETILRKMGSLVLAYSGGVDSTFLLKVAYDVLSDNVLAVIAVSPTYTSEELSSAKNIAKQIGARFKVISTSELSDNNFSSNPVERCYFCKSELFGKLRKLAQKEKLKFVVDGSNISDKLDYRPGSKAKKELGVRSPLQEAGFSKADIRKASKKFGLETWDKPAQACLASRIPYGTKISLPVLSRIQQGESFLHQMGFGLVRLRHYNGLCRIEVPQNDIKRLVAGRKPIVAKLKKIGYDYVSIDLEGYRSGSLNEVIK